MHGTFTEEQKRQHRFQPLRPRKGPKEKVEVDDAGEYSAIRNSTLSQESAENDDIESFGNHKKNRKNVGEKNIPFMDTKDSSGSEGSNHFGGSQLPPLYVDV